MKALEASLLHLLSDLGRIQGLAKGAGDGVRLLREEVRIDGVISVFEEIEGLATRVSGRIKELADLVGPVDLG